MNGSSFLLTAAIALGADPVPAPAAPAPAAITVSGTGCNGCGAAPVTWGGSYAAVPSVMGCDPCAPRAGLFDRLRARLASRPRLFGNNACAPACAPACDPCASAPAPVVAPAQACGCGHPVFTGFTTSCTDPCERQGLLARLRAKFRGGRTCDAQAAPLAGGCCDSSVAGFPTTGCTSSFGTVLTPPPTTGTTPTPDKMPAPTTPPAPMPPADPKKDEPKKELSAAPSVEVPRVPTLGGTSGKY